MRYQVFNLSHQRVIISSRVIQNAHCSRGQRIIAKRTFSQAARAGHSLGDEDHESGFEISRVRSMRKGVVRLVALPENHSTVAGETVVGDVVHDIKSDLQRLRDASQPKSSSTDSDRSSNKAQDKKSVKKGSDDHSDPTTSTASLVRKPSLPKPRQFSIVSPDPKHTTKEQILQMVAKRGRMTRAQYFGEFSNFSVEEAVVILVTPAFAKWLEDDENFIKPLLKSFTYHHENGKLNSVVVVGAVVDGLAPSPNDIPIAERVGPLEGFSFMHGLRTQVLGQKNVWNPELFKKSTTDADKLSHLIILGKPRRNPGEHSLATTIHLPLANTLFVNGKQSTLEISQWTRRSGGEYKRLRSGLKQYQHIKAFHHESTMIPPIFVPAVPLTLPRPIASGLGNIVRQLSFGPEDTDNRSASSELETQVTRYMKYCGLDTTIGVWALIYRTGLLDPNLKAMTLERTENLESTWGDDEKNLRYVGSRLALGAILCRVVSGGGGWGAKQGLLSLDPQVTYEDIASPRFDYTPQSIEEGQDSTLGNLARRGDHIQFFTINPDKLKEYEAPMEDLASAEPSSSDSSVSDEKVALEKYITREPAKTDLNLRESLDLTWSHRSVFGVVPSTIDKLPKSDTAEESTARVPFFSFRKGEFGAVSESGIFLHSSHQKRLQDTGYEHISTKIDMPYSYLYRDQPGTLHTETAEYKLKRALGPRGARDADGIAPPRKMAKVFKAIHGRFPTREEEALRLFEERREIFFKVHGYRPYPEEAERLKLAAAKSRLAFGDDDWDARQNEPPLRKIRVGHTQWPKFSPQEEKDSPPIRKIALKNDFRVRVVAL
ncbi:hypothetical protein DSL72_001679 [Monilinia vaccinii-corymbosi]|uniref:Uncharacterized protein n=1 Tax=Monilinia vaccinii-corymbosi TaxID=61207 RepID=A0A8A3P5B0_9HELO|nr:hypothetical protein DSL72_001679 [Monilinia vaccinii-corymbosi]